MEAAEITELKTENSRLARDYENCSAKSAAVCEERREDADDHESEAENLRNECIMLSQAYENETAKL